MTKEKNRKKPDKTNIDLTNSLYGASRSPANQENKVSNSLHLENYLKKHKLGGKKTPDDDDDKDSSSEDEKKIFTPSNRNLIPKK